MQVTATDVRDASWDGYVDAHPQAGPFHRMAWRELLETHFGHRGHSLIAREGDRVRGVLPLMQLRSALFGRSLVSMPFFMTAGVVADDDATSRALVERARGLAAETRSDLLLIRQYAGAIEGLSRDDSKAAFHVALDPDPDRVFAGFPSQVRRQIRKAKREGLEAAWGPDTLSGFYDVYATNMRDLGVPVLDLGFYRRILERFPDEAGVFVVRHGDVPVAGQFFFVHRDRMILANAGSLRRALRLRPNYLLYWESIRHACTRGLSVCDFGRSPRGTGPFEFKAQWRGEEKAYTTYFADRSGEARAKVDADTGRYGLARRVWRRLPVGLTKWLGPRIVRSIP